MKLRILTKKFTAYFLSNTKVSIKTQMTAIPMNMTYIQALATFRQEVNIKCPPSMTGGNVTRRSQQIQGAHHGRGRGYRVRGAGGRHGRGVSTGQGTEHKPNGAYPDSYPVTYTDGSITKVHPSFYFDYPEWSKLPESIQVRLTIKRIEYKRQ